MRKLSINTVGLFLMLFICCFNVPTVHAAGFDFGDLAKDGGGEFQQQIIKNGTVDVGAVPVGVKDLKVKLESTQEAGDRNLKGRLFSGNFGPSRRE